MYAPLFADDFGKVPFLLVNIFADYKTMLRACIMCMSTMHLKMNYKILPSLNHKTVKNLFILIRTVKF